MSDNLSRLFDIDFPETCSREDVINSIFNDITIDDHSNDSSIKAGYTYIGQMIAHDIVPSTHVNPNRSKLSLKLNLDSLYGDSKSPAFFNGKGNFIQGYAKYSNNIKKLNSDLLRNSDGIAMIPDIRNDENIIISQLHLFWQEFHNTINAVIRKCTKKENCLVETQNIVIKIFHRLVIEDYLPQILHGDIYELYKNKSFSFFYKNNKIQSIPVEFSHAAFRFGHSMVREGYNLNDLHHVRTKNILEDNTKNLAVDSQIFWHNFFKYQEDKNCQEPISKSIAIPHFIRTSQFAKTIDTTIVSAMQKIPIGRGKYKDIRKINIEAGINLDKPLPFGDNIKDELINHCELKSILNHKNYNDSKLKSLHLWPYILKEAELFNNASSLGPIGSLIVGEVLFAVLKLDYGIPNDENLNFILNKIKPESSLDLKHYKLNMWDCIQFVSKN